MYVWNGMVIHFCCYETENSAVFFQQQQHQILLIF